MVTKMDYLLLGSDSRRGLTPEEQEAFGTDENNGGVFRSDTIMLVHLDPNLFRVLGTRIGLGSDFRDEDGTPIPPPPQAPEGQPAPAAAPPPTPRSILSHEFWQRRFGGRAQQRRLPSTDLRLQLASAGIAQRKQRRTVRNRLRIRDRTIARQDHGGVEALIGNECARGRRDDDRIGLDEFRGFEWGEQLHGGSIAAAVPLSK